MKILIVMAGFFPGQKFGGPPVSVDNFCTLMDTYECFIVTRNHDMGESEVYQNVKPGWNDRGNCKVLYLSDEEYGYKQYEEVIQEIKPDIIYLQGLFQNCIIPCLALSKKYQVPVLLAPRGELCKGAFKKKYKKIPYILFLRLFRLLDHVHFQSTSEEETEAILKHLPCDRHQIHFLTNIPSIPQKRNEYKGKENNIAKIVFLSRIVPKKNLDYALKCLANVKAEIYFDIYGTIEDKEYWEKCQTIIKILPHNIHVGYKGQIAHEHVHEVMSNYDAFFFPTKSENFGHVIVEAMAVGCPVIISDQVPWTDVEKYGAGWSISLDKPNSFSEKIQEIAMCTEQSERKMREYAINYFEIKNNLEWLRKEYQAAISNSKYYDM